MATRILITGITSIHGWPVYEAVCSQPGYAVLGIRSPKMNIPEGPGSVPLCITDESGLKLIKDNFRPEIIIHCAGVCDLDVCEERPEWADQLNRGGSQAVAKVFGDSCCIYYLSSDLVFSGNLPPEGGYSESHNPDPLSIAGKTIEAAEREIAECKRHCIIRLGLPIGASITGDKGAVDFIDSRLRRNLPVTLFHDEYRSCISCEDIARGTIKMVEEGAEGLYHFGGPVPASLYGVGEWVLNRGGYDKTLLKGISRMEEKNGPPRIGNVALNSTKIAGVLGFELSEVFTG